MHEIEATEETRKVAESITRRHADVTDIWVFENSVEFKIPVDNRGFWNSDSPDGWGIKEVKGDGDMIQIKVAKK